MRERQAYRNRLDRLIRQTPALSDDLYLRANLEKFACVLVCGYIEVSIREILQEYTRTRASVEVGKYVNSQLEWFRNPNMERILQLVGAFSEEWRESLESETQGRIKLQVDSLVNHRNQIAHGRDVRISHTKLKEYYQSAQAVVELVEERCGGR